MTFLAYELDVEVFQWRKPVDLAEYLSTLTREISRGKLAEDFTELDSTVKARRDAAPDSLGPAEKDSFEV